MDKIPGWIRLLHLPDIHFGHPQIKAEVIHDHLKEIVYPYLNDDLDILSIDGDFFHTLLDMNSLDGFHVNTVISELRELAVIHNFLIRVVRGTFSHDRLQNRFFIKHKDSDTHRVKVFQKPELEYIKEFDIWILYKPDDLPEENVWENMCKLIDQQHIDKVDIFINHGYFEHLLPKNIPHIPHGMLNAIEVKKKVKGVTLNGHIHRPGVYEGVISGGSFERLQFGEEEDKGFFIVDYNKEKHTVKYEFIKNTLAIPFKTFTLPKNKDLSSFKDWVYDLKLNKDEDVRIRVITNDTTLKPALLHIVREVTPKAVLLLKKVKEENLTELTTVVEKVELPILTEENLPFKIKEYLSDKYSKDIDINTITNRLKGGD